MLCYHFGTELASDSNCFYFIIYQYCYDVKDIAPEESLFIWLYEDETGVRFVEKYEWANRREFDYPENWFPCKCHAEEFWGIHTTENSENT